MSQPSRRKGGLGRGLASLIPTGPAEGETEPSRLGGPRIGAAAADVLMGGPPAPAGASDIGAVYREIDPALIEPNPRQPRQVFDDEALSELVHSIREFGLMQPIVVRALDAPGGARYQLVMGERRWRAAQTAGLTAIPAIVRETADDNLLRDALLENIHRAQLNPLEEAAAYQQLLDEFDVTHDELAAADRSVAPADHQHDPVAAVADRSPTPGRGGRAVGRARPGAAVAGGRGGSAGGAGRADRRRGIVGAGHRRGGHPRQSQRAQSAGGAATQADPHARACRMSPSNSPARSIPASR